MFGHRNTFAAMALAMVTLMFNPFLVGCGGSSGGGSQNANPPILEPNPVPDPIDGDPVDHPTTPVTNVTGDLIHELVSDRDLGCLATGVGASVWGDSYATWGMHPDDPRPCITPTRRNDGKYVYRWIQRAADDSYCNVPWFAFGFAFADQRAADWQFKDLTNLSDGLRFFVITSRGRYPVRLMTDGRVAGADRDWHAAYTPTCDGHVQNPTGILPDGTGFPLVCGDGWTPAECSELDP